MRQTITLTYGLAVGIVAVFVFAAAGSEGISAGQGPEILNFCGKVGDQILIENCQGEVEGTWGRDQSGRLIYEPCMYEPTYNYRYFAKLITGKELYQYGIPVPHSIEMYTVSLHKYEGANTKCKSEKWTLKRVTHEFMFE